MQRSRRDTESSCQARSQLGVFKLPAEQAVWILVPALCAYFTDAASHASWGPQEHLKFRGLAKAWSSDAFLFNLAERGDSLKV